MASIAGLGGEAIVTPPSRAKEAVMPRPITVRLRIERAPWGQPVGVDLGLGEMGWAAV